MLNTKLTTALSAVMLLSACNLEQTTDFFAQLLGKDAATQPSESYAEAADDTALEHALKHMDATYVCPMHPQIVSGEPGSCPICGMDLVKQNIETEQTQDTEADTTLPTIRVRPEVQHNMGIRTATVKRETLARTIATVGRITYNENRLAHVHPRAEGWIEQLKVRAAGDRVKKGQNLLNMYAPAVLSAQEDYLVALRTSQGYSAKQQQRLRDAAANRLRLFDVPEFFITQIRKDGKSRNTYPMLAPQAGVVTQIGIREGMYVTPQTELYTIADLSEVWVMVDVYEQQLAWLRKGLAAEMRVAALPGDVWQGKVDYLYPELDSKTRTLTARLRFANPGERLQPNMFANVTITAQPVVDALTIPRAAVIITGKRQNVVVALGEGRFQVVDVEVGIQQQDKVQISAGLAAGQEIVVSGQFLLDSEANLQASFRRFQSGGNGHAH